MQHSTFHRNALASALALALFSPLGALAQEQPQEAPSSETPPPEQGQQPRTLDTITVTGSRIKRAEVEGPAPVTIITGEQMKKEGFATVYDAITTITEATGTVQNDYDWGQTTVNASPLNLRNLGPGRSLLLINGHRVADYPLPYQGKSNFANYNNIPTGIVDRIEILSGSASAIYGSDAIAGVVNVILKENVEGDTVRAKYGTATRGGRQNRDFEWSGGKSGERWSLVYDFQYFDRGALLAKDRPFMDSEEDKPFQVWGPGERHFNLATLTPTPGIFLRDRTDATSIWLAPPSGACEQYGDLFFEAQRLGYDRNSGTEINDGSYCAENVFQNWALRTGSEDKSGYLYGTFDFNDDLQGWASLGVWKSEGTFNSFLPYFFSATFWDPRARDGAGAPLDFAKDFSPEELGSEDMVLTKTDETSIDFQAGLRGKFGDRFDWELSAGRATYSVEERFPAQDQAAMRDYFLGPQLGTTADGLPIYEPDYDRLWNPMSPDTYATFGTRGRKKARSWLNQAQFVVNGDLFDGWAGPISFAGDLEWAKQGYRLTPDPRTLPGPNGEDPQFSTPFGNIEQGGGERNHYAAGVEFRVPLAKQLTLSAAGRYDKYDAVASDAATTYNLGLEWRPFSTLLLRGSYATSFRAPDMHFVYAAPSVGISDAVDYLACIQDRQANGGNPGDGCPGGNGEPWHIDNATISRQGTPDLLYEEGDSITYGFVWDAFDGFSLSADYWKIKIENQIDDIGFDQVLLDEAYCLTGQTPDGSPRVSPPSQALCDLQTSRVVRDANGTVTGIQVGPINRAEQIVSGVDVAARYQVETGIGAFSFNLNYTNQMTYEGRQFPGDELVDDRKNQIRSKITAGVNWNYDRWNATLFMTQKSGRRNNRWGGCLPFDDGYVPTGTNDCVDTDPDSPTFGEQTERIFGRNAPRRYFSGSLGYQVNDDFKINFYVNNIFDKIYRDNWCGDFAYCVDDPVGREVAAEIVYKID